MRELGHETLANREEIEGEDLRFVLSLEYLLRSAHLVAHVLGEPEVPGALS